MTTIEEHTPQATEPARAQSGAPDVFVSYASQDAAVADAVVAALERAAIRCWIAPRDVVPGALYADEIVGAINEAKVVVLILSEAAAASSHVGKELERASSKRRRIVALRTDAASLPRAFEYFLSESQWIDVGSGGIEAAAAKLVDAVRRHLAPASGTEWDTRLAAPVPDGTVAAPRRWLLGVSATVLVMALAYLVLDKIWVNHIAAKQSTSVATNVVSKKSIAVLPFVDMSEKQDQAYFGDGMAEEVIGLLDQVPGLRVTGRTSSFQFRGKSLDVRTIGSQLQSAYVLEGSVRRSDDQVRVTAQLVGTQDGVHRWSGTYDAKLDNIIQVQEAIAAAISRSLELAISDLPTQDRSATSAEAYDLYMRGLHALDSSSKEGCQQAIGLFSQILRQEPNSERGLISLALAHECIAWGGWSTPAAGLPQAREFAARALGSNPKSAAAHLVLATVNIEHDFDWPAAQREIDAAFNLSPPNARALTVAARLQQAIGQFDRAIDLLNQALEREPLDPLIYDTLGDTYMRAGQYEKAQAMYRRCLEIAPSFIVEHFYVSNALLMRGRLEEALAEANLETDDEAADFGRALVFHAMGKSADSDAALKRALAANAIHWSAEVARVHAFRGELDQSFEWLDRAYQQRDVDLYYMKGDPFLKNLEADPRFHAFLRKMNLPE
jgi:TolB-like protein/Flp pilus assembly protein TadD